MQTTIGKTKLCLVTGDIADQDTDAVVTAAHWRLNKGNGTDGTIHTKGGPRIYEECRRIGGCPIGDAVITTGGNLKARHVIHAVGPVWRGGDEDEPKILASAYRRSLEVAAQHGLHSISIPSISTGAFGYPIRLAAPVALKAIVEFLRRGQHSLDEVRMVLYTREDDTAYAVYAGALEQLLKEMPQVEVRNRAMNILYVENHAVFAANVTRQFLTQHSVTTVSSLAAARAALTNGVYDLLLVDYDLDDGKGDELVRELRASGSRVVVVGVSSHDEGNAALLKAGAVTVCSKMNFDRIQSVIDSVTKDSVQNEHKSFYRIIGWSELEQLKLRGSVPRNHDPWGDYQPGTIICLFEDTDFMATLHKFASALAEQRDLRPGNKLYVLQFFGLQPNRIVPDSTANGWPSSRIYLDPVSIDAVRVVAGMTIAGDGPQSIQPGPVERFEPAISPRAVTRS